MTTVIADRRTLEMAADRLMNDRGLRTVGTKVQKLTVTWGKGKTKPFLQSGEEVLVGLAGMIQYQRGLFDWVGFGMPHDALPACASQEDTFQMLVMTREQLFLVENACMPSIVEDHDFYAIGTGSHAAMSALYAGLPLIDAMHIAHKVDFYTGDSFDRCCIKQ